MDISFVQRLSLRLFKELPYSYFSLKKPKISNNEALETLRKKSFHFQYAFGMPGIVQDFSNPRYENLLVSSDILKQIRGIRSVSPTISICESAPLDGYITWRLSQLQKSSKYSINLNALEIQKGNCEKIELVSKVFGYDINVYNSGIESFKGGPFDFYTMLGVSYLFEYPLKTLDHVITKLLKPGSFFYFDLLHSIDSTFVKATFMEIERTKVEGFSGIKCDSRDKRTEEEQAFYLNHSPSATSTIIYEDSVLYQFFSRYENISLEVIFISTAPGYKMVTYRAHIQNN